MARYIDADRLIENLKECRKTQQKYASYTAVKLTDFFFAALKNEPTADVEEVKRAKWIPNSSYKYYYYCSVCGRSVRDVTENPNIIFPYCHCGAKMDGKDINVPTTDGGKEE